MRAILILAGGDSERLKEAGLLGSLPNKVLISIGSEPNIVRTVRLCEQLRNLPVLVVNERTAKASKGLSITDAMSCFSPHFDEFVVVLGDVVWQPSELETLLNMPVGQALYHPNNPFTEKPYEEFLGAVVSRRHTENVSSCTALRQLPQLAGFLALTGPGWSDDIDTPDDFLIRLPLLRALVAKEVA